MGSQVAGTDGVTVRSVQPAGAPEARRSEDRPASETVCWCFSITAGEIETEWRDSGRSLLRERIRRETSEGRCSCARMNPDGRCCLPDVDRLIADLEGSEVL